MNDREIRAAARRVVMAERARRGGAPLVDPDVVDRVSVALDAYADASVDSEAA